VGHITRVSPATVLLSSTINFLPLGQTRAPSDANPSLTAGNDGLESKVPSNPQSPVIANIPSAHCFFLAVPESPGQQQLG
jgi:hypothetical protein